MRNLVAIFRDGFVDGGQSHDTSFLSLLLALGTFYIAMSLMRMRAQSLSASTDAGIPR
ncbi:MAG: hypothetical protein R3C11_10580 [Planctomycetaceae bacterium]